MRQNARFLPKVMLGVAVIVGVCVLSGWTFKIPKDTLVVATGALPTTVDPAINQGRPTQDVLIPISSGLVRYKSFAQDRTTLQGPTALEGDVAEAWTRDDAGNYTFTLRRNARSQFGKVVTSADVKYSFERAIANDAIARSLVNTGAIDRQTPIQVIDPRRFVLRVTQRNNITLPMLTYYGFGILDATEIAKHTTTDDPWARNWLGTNSAGFGPYALQGIQPAIAVSLRANPNYWQEGVPVIRNVVYRAVADESARMLLLRVGDVDIVTQATADSLSRIRTAAGVTTLGAKGLDQNFDTIAINNTVAPYSDPRVRRAISMGIDRNAIIKTVYAGLGRPALGAVSSVIPQPKLPTTAGFKYDPNGARALLAQAGLGSGFTMNLNITPTRPGPYAQPLAELIQSQLGQIGIKVEITVTSTPAEQTAAINAKRLQAWLAATRPAVLDPVYLIRLAYSSLGTPTTGYSNKKIDQLSELMLTTPFGNRRDRIVTSAIKILDDEMPVVPLVETILPWAYRNNVVGVEPNPWGTLHPWKLSKK